jgi:outer membrane biosynthesis protein TonB
MRRIHRIVFLAVLGMALPALSGCADFDADKLDIFNLNEKKKLPGDRKPVFPEGVPGVSQGIPSEYIKGNQPPPETAQAVPAIPVEPEKPAAAKPKKTAAFTQDEKPKRKPKPRPPVAAQQQQQAPAGQQQPAPWPEQGQNQSTTSSSGTPWPAAPAPGTFSR